MTSNQAHEAAERRWGRRLRRSQLTRGVKLSGPNYPNDNPIATDHRSAYSDADDLAALIGHVGLGRVDVVDTSAGALAALVLATEEPGMVRTLVLAEPPV